MLRAPRPMHSAPVRLPLPAGDAPWAENGRCEQGELEREDTKRHLELPLGGAVRRGTQAQSVTSVIEPSPFVVTSRSPEPRLRKSLAIGQDPVLDRRLQEDPHGS